MEDFKTEYGFTNSDIANGLDSLSDADFNEVMRLFGHKYGAHNTTDFIEWLGNVLREIRGEYEDDGVENITFGIHYDPNRCEVQIYRIYDDGNLHKVASLFESEGYIHFDIGIGNFKYVPILEEQYKFFSENMVDVDLGLLYSELVDRGMMNIF